MADLAERFIPFWVKDPWPSYSLDKLPIWFPSEHTKTWATLTSKGIDEGWWVTCDPFPENIAATLKGQIKGMERDEHWNVANMIGPYSLLERLHETADLRILYRDLRGEPSSQFDQTVPSYEFLIKQLNVAISAQKWSSLRGYRGPRRPEGNPSPKQIKTIRPESHKVYWLAVVGQVSSTTLAILETSGHVDLSYPTDVYVWAYGRQVKLYLPVAEPPPVTLRGSEDGRDRAHPWSCGSPGSAHRNASKSKGTHPPRSPPSGSRKRPGCSQGTNPWGHPRRRRAAGCTAAGEG